MLRQSLRSAAVSLGLLAITVLLLGTVLAIAGYDPVRSLDALWRGSFGSWYALTSATLVRAIPLTIAGLATTLAFRAGVLNIGVEGQLLCGAAAAATVVLAWPSLGVLLVPIGLAAGALGGLVWVTVPVLLRRRLGVLEVITTLLMNAIATQLLSWLVRGPLQEPTHTYPQSATIVDGARLPVLFAGTQLHAGALIALGLAAFLWWFFKQTAAGFRVHVTGANARAAASAGSIDVSRLTARVFLASGAIAGVAGAVELQGTTLALYDTISPGYGYASIAVALLAALEPRAIVPSAILFGALEAGAGAMQRDAGVPVVAVKIVEALLIVAVLALMASQRRRQLAVAGT
jgi:ABC-type uncharacterized transport system permease subunit